MRSPMLSKEVAGFLCLSILALAASAVAGAQTHSLMGYPSLGFFVFCSGIAATTAISLRAPVTTFRTVRYIWLITAIVSLILGLEFGRDAGDVPLSYGMAALAFPLGMFAAPLARVITSVHHEYGFLAFWLAIVAIGYLQWFVILFRMLNRQKAAAKH